MQLEPVILGEKTRYGANGEDIGITLERLSIKENTIFILRVNYEYSIPTVCYYDTEFEATRAYHNIDYEIKERKRNTY